MDTKNVDNYGRNSYHRIIIVKLTKNKLCSSKSYNILNHKHKQYVVIHSPGT